MALSGGGARGIAHLGVVKALEEHKIEFDVISGTSAGAIAGLFLAKGFSAEETLDIFVKAKFYKLLRPAINLRGLFKINSLETLMKPFFENDSFETLQKPFYVSATNVRTGKIRVFSQGKVMIPVMASCCIPVVFEPMKIGADAYMDGGIINNLPVEPLIGKVDRIIGVHSNPISQAYNGRNMKKLMERSLLLAINENVATRKNKCDLFIEPTELKDYTVFDFRKAKEIFKVGYEYANDLLSNKSVLSKFRTLVS